jgi:DNA polymerase-3 subunit chi
VTKTSCEIWFYHLERARLEQVLPELLEKTMARGWRGLVRACVRERIDQLDDWLWAYRDDSFLAHSVEGDPLAERAPIVLSAGPQNPNQAQALFLIDGAAPGDLTEFERCILIFDGQDETAVVRARAMWTEFRATNHVVAYWRQGAEKGWERRA